MYCHQCGQLTPEGARFCGKCGAKLTDSSSTQPKAPTSKLSANTTRFGSSLERLGAALIDRIILILSCGLIGLIVGFLLALPLTILGINQEKIEGSATVVGYLLGGALNIIYFVGMHGKYGATIGKKLFKIRVVTEELQPIGFGKAALRDIIGKLFSLWILGLGYFWILWDEKKQGWHDKIAETVVIKEK